MNVPDPISKLIDGFMRLPGIGPKTAQRLAFFVLGMEEEDVMDLAKALVRAKRDLKKCQVCSNITDQSVCSVCRDKSRNRASICVVQDPRDVIAMERTREYHGLYHVLHGAISPMEGIGPDELSIPDLLKRLEDETVPRADSCNQSKHRRGSNRHVYSTVGEAFWIESDSDCTRPSCWWGSGVCG